MPTRFTSGDFSQVLRNAAESVSDDGSAGVAIAEITVHAAKHVLFLSMPTSASQSGTTRITDFRRTLHTGITPAAGPAVVTALLAQREPATTLVVCPDLPGAERFLEATESLLNLVAPEPRPNTVLLPPGEAGRDGEAEADRLHVFNLLRETPDRSPGSPLVVVTTAAAALDPAPDPEMLRRREIRLSAGEEIRFQELIERLRNLDYDCESLCENPGQYAVRGGIVDVYPVAAETPYRIDFFGDTIEEIRAFDPADQRSSEAVPSILVSPSATQVTRETAGSLADYLDPSTRWILAHPETWSEDAFSAFRESDLLTAAARPSAPQSSHHWHVLSDLDNPAGLFPEPCRRSHWETESLDAYRPIGNWDSLSENASGGSETRAGFFRQLLHWYREGFDIALFTHNEGEESRLREILAEDASLRGFHPTFCRGAINEGFLFRHTEPGRFHLRPEQATPDPSAPPRRGIVVVSDGEIFGRYRQHRPVRRHRKRVLRSQVEQLLDFSELSDGDYLVHVQHGICRFRGINLIESRGERREMISVEFDGDVTLHVPFHESHLLTRYVGLAKARPALGRIGSGQWEKTRRAAEKATFDFAAELLRTQALRETRSGFTYPPDDNWQREFEAAFLHTETRDQLRAAGECKADMEKTKPMDRLLCGDVGYGKTEVAMRAAFKAVMAGKQVAVLVPTTVLAQQHFQTFRERMADYPVIVDMLSRFRSRPRQAKIISALSQGKIDIIIGTHRLLSADLRFRELGLVVIDEEHRFGLKQKENLKRMRESVEILSMSATPIPRTLYLALSGARDLSVIETPPVDRLPIKTIVRNYDPKLIVDAIRLERRRGGQIFYLHNRVDTIESVAARLREMVPEIRIAVGHGQMPEKVLERIMTEFTAGRYDLLVSTTIIESGLDIPNCNTLIVETADRFGLSQLYQLRGRVGRFKNQAYAYLLLHRHGRVHEIARKRLAALRQHNQLGAGFKIAMRDLELRGAGNLLGTKQSGHIAGVGFDLYCQLLRQSIARLKGEKSAAAIRATLRIDFLLSGEGQAEKTTTADRFAALKESELRDKACPPIEARIPDSYIPEVRLRLDTYRRLAMAAEPREVDELRNELTDRFGPPPDATEALIRAAAIRCLAEQKEILAVETEGNRLKCLRASGNRNDYIRVGSRFPRLTGKQALSRLREIATFLKRI